MEDAIEGELGERLEAVRADAGLSLRAFWRELVGGGGGGGFDWENEDGDGPRYGYRTVTRYHRGEREAPVEYVARVAEIFGVRVEWLVNGSGSMKRPPWEKGFIHHPLYRSLLDQYFFEGFPLPTLGDRWRFLDLHRAYEWSDRRHPPGKGPGPLGRAAEERAKDLRFLLRLPLIAWGYGHVHDVPVEYWRGVMGALDSAVRRFHEKGESRAELFVWPFRELYEGPPNGEN